MVYTTGSAFVFYLIKYGPIVSTCSWTVTLPYSPHAILLPVYFVGYYVHGKQSIDVSELVQKIGLCKHCWRTPEFAQKVVNIMVPNYGPCCCQSFVARMLGQS